MKRLSYNRFNNSNDILMIDLHNNYTVIALSGWNRETSKYNTTLFLKENTTDMWSLIETAKNIEFDAIPKTICMEILKHVSKLFEDGFFDYYINRYKYELKCFDKGYEILESEVPNAE